jgi:hypothetical protein
MNTKSADFDGLHMVLAQANEVQADQLTALLVPSIEAVEIGLSHQIDDLARDTAMGFAEVHGKIEFLRGEIMEIKQLLNGLIP